MLTDEQREQLRLIQRCDPSFLLLSVKGHTNFDSALLKKVFELAKEQASSLLSTSAAPAEGRETADEKFNPYVEPEATTNQTLTEAIEWCIAHGNCGPRTRATLIAARSALATAPTMPHEGREPTRDELRKLVREIRDASGGPSDAPQPADYVLGGWRAAIDTAPTKPADGRGVKAYLYQHKQSGKTTFVTPELSRDEFEGMNPEYAYVGALVLATAPTMSDAARDVLAERWRQVTAEGWTPEHDDEHSGEEMALAAIAYAESAVGYHIECPDTWPWSPKWWKPTTPRRDLVKAGALILAEIERIDRAAAKGGSK